MASEKSSDCSNDPSFAVICSFLEQFGEKCDIAYPPFSKLKLMLESIEEVDPSLKLLHIRLLRKARRQVKPELWERALVTFCRSVASESDSWELERFGYRHASLSVKLRILKNLCECQFDRNKKLKEAVNAMSAACLRLQPLGYDRHGNSYWWHLDALRQLRVYCDDPEEETWRLVAEDRQGLVSLIDQLKADAGSNTSTEVSSAAQNKDSDADEVNDNASSALVSPADDSCQPCKGDATASDDTADQQAGQELPVSSPVAALIKTESSEAVSANSDRSAGLAVSERDIKSANADANQDDSAVSQYRTISPSERAHHGSPISSPAGDNTGFEAVSMSDLPAPDSQPLRSEASADTVSMSERRDRNSAFQTDIKTETSDDTGKDYAEIPSLIKHARPDNDRKMEVECGGTQLEADICKASSEEADVENHCKSVADSTITEANSSLSSVSESAIGGEGKMTGLAPEPVTDRSVAHDQDQCVSASSESSINADCRDHKVTCKEPTEGGTEVSGGQMAVTPEQHSRSKTGCLDSQVSADSIEMASNECSASAETVSSAGSAKISLNNARSDHSAPHGNQASIEVQESDLRREIDAEQTGRSGVCESVNNDTASSVTDEDTMVECSATNTETLESDSGEAEPSVLGNVDEAAIVSAFPSGKSGIDEHEVSDSKKESDSVEIAFGEGGTTNSLIKENNIQTVDDPVSTTLQTASDGTTNSPDKSRCESLPNRTVPVQSEGQAADRTNNAASCSGVSLATLNKENGEESMVNRQTRRNSAENIEQTTTNPCSESLNRTSTCLPASIGSSVMCGESRSGRGEDSNEPPESCSALSELDSDSAVKRGDTDQKIEGRSCDGDHSDTSAHRTRAETSTSDTVFSRGERSCGEDSADSSRNEAVERSSDVGQEENHSQPTDPITDQPVDAEIGKNTEVHSHLNADSCAPRVLPSVPETIDGKQAICSDNGDVAVSDKPVHSPVDRACPEQADDAAITGPETVRDPCHGEPVVEAAMVTSGLGAGAECQTAPQSESPTYHCPAGISITETRINHTMLSAVEESACDICVGEESRSGTLYRAVPDCLCDDADVVIESPVFLVVGQGWGADNTGGNSLSDEAISNGTVLASSPPAVPQSAVSPEPAAAVGQKKRGRRKRTQLDSLIEATAAITSSEHETGAVDGGGRRRSTRVAKLRQQEESERLQQEEHMLRTLKQRALLKKIDSAKRKVRREARALAASNSDASATIACRNATSKSAKMKASAKSLNKKKKKKKRGRKKTGSGGKVWKESTTSSSSECESAEADDADAYDDFDDELFGEDRAANLADDLFHSDHEFSPESDLDCSTAGADGDGENSGAASGEISTVRRARTARSVRSGSSRRKTVDAGGDGVKCLDSVESDDDDDAATESPSGGVCGSCGSGDHPEFILLCDKCDCGWHTSCLRPPLLCVPEGSWFCPPCQHASLVSALHDCLARYDASVEQRDNDQLRRQRLEYVNISMANVLPECADDDDDGDGSKSASAAQRRMVKKRARRSGRQFDESAGEDSGDGSSSDENESSGTSADDEDDKSDDSSCGDDNAGSDGSSVDGAVSYRRRARRATATASSERVKQFDRMIDDAIRDDLEEMAVFDDQKCVEPCDNAVGNGEKVQPGAVSGDDDQHDGDVKRTTNALTSVAGRRRRRINDLDDVESDAEDDDASFHVSSGSGQEDFDPDEDSEDFDPDEMDCLRTGGRKRRHQGRQSVAKSRRRSSRKKRSSRKYYSDSEESENSDDDGSSSDNSWRSSSRKRQNRRTSGGGGGKRSLRQFVVSTDSDVSDRSWGRAKKRRKRSNPTSTKSAGRRSAGKSAGGRKRRASGSSDSRSAARRKKVSAAADDGAKPLPARRTRGKQANYSLILQSDSDSDTLKPIEPMSLAGSGKKAAVASTSGSGEEFLPSAEEPEPEPVSDAAITGATDTSGGVHRAEQDSADPSDEDGDTDADEERASEVSEEDGNGVPTEAVVGAATDKSHFAALAKQDTVEGKGTTPTASDSKEEVCSSSVEFSSPTDQKGYAASLSKPLSPQQSESPADQSLDSRIEETVASVATACSGDPSTDRLSGGSVRQQSPSKATVTEGSSIGSEEHIVPRPHIPHIATTVAAFLPPHISLASGRAPPPAVAPRFLPAGAAPPEVASAAYLAGPRPAYGGQLWRLPAMPALERPLPPSFTAQQLYQRHRMPLHAVGYGLPRPMHHQLPYQDHLRLNHSTVGLLAATPPSYPPALLAAPRQLPDVNSPHPQEAGGGAAGVMSGEMAAPADVDLENREFGGLASYFASKVQQDEE